MRSSPSRCGGDRVVEVARARRVDRERRQRAQIAPAAGDRTDVVGPGGGRLARLVLDRRVERAPQPAVDHQRLDHVARHVGAPDPARDRRPSAARVRCGRVPGAHHDQIADRHAAIAADTASRGPDSKNGSATRNLPRRSITATRGTGRARAAPGVRCRAHRTSAATVALGDL